MNVLVSGGGTGGHFYPALALLAALQARGMRVGYVGTHRGLEAPPLTGCARFAVHARGIERRLTLANLAAAAQLARGIVEAIGIVRRFRPQLIIGTGGYGALPILLAGLRWGISTAILEPNAQPGWVTRALARWVNAVWLAYPQTATQLRARRSVVTGVPVRPEILSLEGDGMFAPFVQERAREHLGLSARKPTVLVVGGSHGSAFLSECIRAGRERWAERGIQVLLVTGRGKGGRTPATDGVIVVREYLKDGEMARALRAADLVVCRAGAVTLAEVSAAGKPAVVVPWPDAADNHQWVNARHLERLGACRLLREDEPGAATRLVEVVLALLNDPPTLRHMSRSMRRAGLGVNPDRILREVESFFHGQ